MVEKPNIVWVSGALHSGGRRPAIPTHITMHHVVGDAAAAIAEARNPNREMSFTFTIGSDGTIYQMLDLMTIPFTDTNYDSNRRAITIEHAGGTSNVPYTEAMYRSSIKLCAWLRQEFNIPESNMLRHQQVARDPTACPGGLDTERIKRESTKILQGVIDMAKRLIPPNIVREHYINYTGTVIDPNSQTLQNRYEDPEDDEFWYGLVRMMNDIRKSQAQALSDLNTQIGALTAQASELVKRPTKAALDELHSGLLACQEDLKKKDEELGALKADQAANEKTAKNIFQIVAEFFKRFKS